MEHTPLSQRVIWLHSPVVLMAALPTGSNVLIFAQRYRTLEAEATTAIVLSTVGYMATVTLWLAVLARLG